MPFKWDYTSSETAFFSADIRPEKSPCNQGKLCQHWKQLKLKISNFSIFQGWQSLPWLHGLFSGLKSALKKAVSELVWIPLECLCTTINLYVKAACAHLQQTKLRQLGFTIELPTIWISRCPNLDLKFCPIQFWWQNLDSN